MIYLIGKIIAYLIGALGIGFGMGWMLQVHLARKLREQLNSVIFETKSRIPQLETEVTNRDQTIEQLQRDLSEKPRTKNSKTSKDYADQATDSEQTAATNADAERTIKQLNQRVAELESELRTTTSIMDGPTPGLMIDDASDEDATPEEAQGSNSDKNQDEADDLLDADDLMSDDEFLADIQDIFDLTTDENIEAFGPAAIDTTAGTNGTESADEDSTAEKKDSNSEQELEMLDGIESSVSLRDAAENDSESAVDLPEQVSADMPAETVVALESQISELADARKQLSDLTDSQNREIADLHQQQALQEKSLTVLNQQLELSRLANERILTELRETRDSQAADDNQTSAG
jgi:uncharacterized coiled-coil protein SlyX